MFRSATFKLTMWYLAIVMAISLMFSIILYQVTTHELSRGLSRETERIYSQFPIFDENPLLRPGTDYQTSAHRIWLRLVGFNLIVLIGAGFASYWLAKRTLEPIEAAHEQQKRFTADVSHELRTPLTALRMESEVALLSNDLTKHDLQKTIKSNLEEVGKLEALINSLLRLTRLEADELQQNFTNLNVQDLVESATSQVKSKAKTQKITIDNSVAAATIQGDQDSLVQLLVILLDNAIKYSQPNSMVKLTSKRQKGEVIINVIDHGVGIEPEALAHVFDRFYRSDSSRNKSETDGYGLGLSIAKMIADIHDAHIKLTSRLGHGTTASLRLSSTEPSRS